MAKDKQTDFESSLKALESIVKRLEDENINLEDFQILLMLLVLPTMVTITSYSIK